MLSDLDGTTLLAETQDLGLQLIDGQLVESPRVSGNLFQARGETGMGQGRVFGGQVPRRLKTVTYPPDSTA